jgi:hypothetical protein
MLLSLQGYPIDIIIAVDGRYKDYNAPNKLSSKECRSLFNSFQTPFLLVDAPDEHQNDKRQIYFDLSRDENLDALIVMDSDEFFIPKKTNWALFTKELEEKIVENKFTWRRGYSIPVLLKHKGTEEMPDDYIENLPRLFVTPGNMRYVDDHYTIRNRHTGVMMTYQEPTLLHNIMMGHDHKLRSDKYNKATEDYENNLIKYEDSVRIDRQNSFSKTLQSVSG